MKLKKFFLSPIILIIFFLLALLNFPIQAQNQEISPAQEQEFFDAQKAWQAAQQAQAEKYALEQFQKAQDLLTLAEKARSIKDPIKFVQASRLARAYAELAQTIAELRSEEERLAIAYEELYKAQAEISRLRQRP